MKTKKKIILWFLSLKSREDQKKGPNIIQHSDADHSQIIGGMQSNYWGDIPPVPPPPVSAPLFVQGGQASRVSTMRRNLGEIKRDFTKSSMFFVEFKRRLFSRNLLQLRGQTSSPFASRQLRQHSYLNVHCL